jgi:glucose-6-phosphate dehydrogenase assembly protein OpcA
MAGTVVVDSKEAGGPSTFDRLLELSRLRAVVDLSWERLLPWREMLAGMFEGAAFRPFVTGVTSVAVSGKPGPRHLLGGWISSRLGLPPDAVELSDARHVSLRLRCEHRGAKASFEAVRTEGERLVRGRAVIEGGPRNQEMLPLPADSLSWFLAKALTHLEPDPTWREAVEAANGLGP